MHIEPNLVARWVVSLLPLLAVGLDAAAEEVRGRWLTEPEPALAEARRLGKPVLAVAMDHA